MTYNTKKLVLYLVLFLCHSQTVIFSNSNVEKPLLVEQNSSYSLDGSDLININCPQGSEWQNEKRGVVYFTYPHEHDNDCKCSGSLINNTSLDGRQYVLTAKHCLHGSVDSLEKATFHFNYESINCAGTTTTSEQKITGCKVRAWSEDSDFLLLEITDPIPAHYNVYFNGWNRLATPANSSVGIHHPATDLPKKISLDADACNFAQDILEEGDNFNLSKNPENYWSANFDEGDTHAGSSGSPLFDENHRIVGQLLGTIPPSGEDRYANYGRFDISWDNGIEGDSCHSLKYWLDPLNTGEMSIEGRSAPYPNLTINNFNYQDIYFTNDIINIPIEIINTGDVATQENFHLTFYLQHLSSNDSLLVKTSFIPELAANSSYSHIFEIDTTNFFNLNTGIHCIKEGIHELVAIIDVLDNIEEFNETDNAIRTQVVKVLSESINCTGCTDESACNYDEFANENEGCDYSCIGCTDETACNYNASANENDGSCDYSCIGCTDNTACNYSPNFSISDNSCDYTSCSGCTDNAACNYNADATINNGSCDYSCIGCTDNTACNYNSQTYIDDDSCDYSCIGCTDNTACNYDPNFSISDDSCDYTSCLGCMDMNACNYNSEASIDDGSCGYNVPSSFENLATNYCNTDLPVTLIPISPGGTFSGEGISDNVFDPSMVTTLGEPISINYIVGPCTSISIQETTVESCLTATASFKVFLEGAYNKSTGKMNTHLLNQNLLPLNQPYNTAPWNYNGGESVSNYSNFPINTVDWILLEMRTGTPNESGTKGTTLVERLSGLLLEDGTIVSPQNTPLAFTELDPDIEHHILIRHRNHLSIISKYSVQTNTEMSYDFTQDIEMTFGFKQQKNINGSLVMFGGNYLHDNVIQSTDNDVWQQDPAVINTYQIADGTLDGTVQLTDQDLWNKNKAKTAPIEISLP